MIKHLIGAAIAIAVCPTPPADVATDTPPVPSARPAQHIYIGEGYDTPFDARSGDTITVILNPQSDPIERCNHMGGEPIYNPYTLIWSCDDVDF